MADGSKGNHQPHPRPPGRPKLARPKEQLTLRLDADVVSAFRATGKGWQARINALLIEAVQDDKHLPADDPDHHSEQ